MATAKMKVSLVLLLLVAGILFLAGGIGVTLPLVKYEGIEATGVPVGIALVVAGIVLAAFWKVSTTTTVEKTSTETLDGISVTTKTETKKTTRVNTLAGPKDF